MRHCPYCGVETASARLTPAATLATSAPSVPPALPETVTPPKAVDSKPIPPPVKKRPRTAAPIPVPPPLPTANAAEPSATPVVATHKIPVGPPSRTVASEPQAPVLDRKPSGSKLPIALAALLFVGAAVYWLSRPSEKEVACNTQLASAAEKLAAGDAVGARGQTVLALASCSADSRSKAAALQSAADKALVVRANCEKGLRRAESLIGEHRLQSARSAMDQLDTACVDAQQAKTLRLQLDAGQSAASSAESDVRQKIAMGDVKAARISLDQLSAANREHPEIAALRTEIQNAAKAQEDAAAIAAAAAAAPPPPAFVDAPARPNAVQAAQQDLVSGFLRDAEMAMAELKFDKAKTYVESARRIDPGNTQAAFLARRIKERELEYARKEMTIN